MFQWLLWGQQPKPKAKHLAESVEKLLAAGPQSGENPFPLSEKELKRLCSAARDSLLKEPSLVEITTSSASVVVVGDLHGQYCDLQRIFEQLGRPGSDGKVWVFLGDYIDRGPCGLEIVATLLALKLHHPSSIYLLRGNHECSEITVLFGFCGECQRRSTLAVWESVMQVFDALPLAALLNGKVFLCHGGISPYLGSPRDVNAIKRPLDVNPNGEGLLSDLLWADPSPHVSGWRPNPRGVSFVFGLDVARQWMAAQGVRAIVRAHMVQQAGFEVLGDNEVMTVFSASDYRESGNTGAVLMIAPSLDFKFVTFPALRSDASEPSVHEVFGEGPAWEQARAAAAAAAAASSQGQPPDKFSSPLPQQPVPAAPDGLAPRLTMQQQQQQRSPFAPAVVVGPAAEPAVPVVLPGGAAPTPAEQALQQEVEEDRLAIEQVVSDADLAQVVHKRSAGLQELEALTGGSRVPAVALARTSSSASGSRRCGSPTAAAAALGRASPTAAAVALLSRRSPPA